jgi:hypothetical protein
MDFVKLLQTARFGQQSPDNLRRRHDELAGDGQPFYASLMLMNLLNW